VSKFDLKVEYTAYFTDLGAKVNFNLNRSNKGKEITRKEKAGKEKEVGTNLKRDPYKWSSRILPTKNLDGGTKFENKLELSRGSSGELSFIEKIKTAVSMAKQTIVLPEGSDDRVIQASKQIIAEGFAEVVILNPKEEVEGAISIDVKTASNLKEFALKLYDYRKHKGLSEKDAFELIQNPLYYGTMLVKEGLADGMVAGAATPTPNVLRPALQILKTAPGTKLVSAFFAIVPNPNVSNHHPMIFADCGIIPEPNAEELSEIAITSAKTCELLTGEKARIAMLSYSTLGSARGKSIDKMVEAVRLVKQRDSKILVEGELQFDTATVPEIAASKAPNSKIAGQANVMVFPDLNAGNIGYKIAERIGGARAYGPILQGIAKPVNDLSRGCSAEDIVGVVAITALQAIDEKESKK